MQKKLQIFVSSTYNDMKEERQAVVQAILEAGHIPAGMELFAAADKTQWETIQKWIDDSDAFMLILGGRYGSLEPESGKSYTHLEYEYAIDRSKPYFAAVIHERLLKSKSKSKGYDIVETQHGEKYAELKSLVTGKICRFFSDMNELKVIVFQSLSKLAEQPTLQGWVRRNETVDPKAILDQINRLQTENTELRQQLAAYERASRLYAEQTPNALAARLSDDAKALLEAASKSDGYITQYRHLDGSTLMVGKKNFLSSDSNREEARWESALDELSKYKLVKSTGSKDKTYSLTKLGYETADLLFGERHSA